MVTLDPVVVTNDKLQKNNGFVELNEDCEMSLNFGVNKITIGVYANRTFKEDLLLFYNDVSLRKLLSTEDVS
jgi:hypothetical protein